MNIYLSAVNQKLYYSKLLLKQSQPETCGMPLLQEALYQSALYQLECGYRYYLREVAATYQFKLPESISVVEDLVAALSSINKHPAEAQEMASLEANPESWLNQMLSAHQQLSTLPQHDAKTTQSSPIAVMQIDQQEERVALGEQELTQWQRAFEEMVDRHRELMIEC